MALSAWQQAIVWGVAVASVGFMACQTVRLQARRSRGLAVARKGTPSESGLYGAQAPAGAHVFDGFSYRVSARFAGRARVVVEAGRISFCAPRGPAGLYWFWIWAMGLSLALVAPALAWAAVALDWRGLVWAAVIAVLSTLIMAIGAGVWPGLGEVPGLEDGLYPALEHDIADARDVAFGEGWANGGLRWILLPYADGITQFATDHAVSWFGPDERGREVRYALHCYDAEQAKRLHELVNAGAGE